MKLSVSLAIAVCLLTGAPAARAEGDGVYGRFDGDLDGSLVAGAQVAAGGPSVVVGARALFLGTVGAYAALAEATGDSSPAPRTVSVGASFRPLFIPRWGLDLEHGPAWLDLTLDATTFDLGVLWASPRRSLSERPGFEAALGAEFPLLARAAGPWLGVRGALRWRGTELSGDSESRLGPALAFTLSWHFLAAAHLVDLGDRARR
jgi:hypothetical protein